VKIEVTRVAVVVLVASTAGGCGADRVLASDTGSGEVTSSSGTDGETSSSGDGDTGDGDGQPGDGDGDGQPPDECAEDECSIFEVCEEGACVVVGKPPPSCARPPYGPPTMYTIGLEYGAPTFVDVDADGADELLIAVDDWASEPAGLYLFEAGADTPTFAGAPMGLGHPGFDLAAGYFDAQPGEDLALIAFNDWQPPVYLLSSDGVASFTVEPEFTKSPIGDIFIRAGNFNGLPEDLLFGTHVLRLDGADLPLNEQEALVSAFQEQGTTHPGIVLALGTMLVRYDFGGMILASVEQPTNHLESVLQPGQPSYLATEYHREPHTNTHWSRLRLRDAEDLAFISEFVLPGHTVAIAGDFDGDLEVELFVVPMFEDASAAVIVRDLFTAPCLVAQPFGVDESMSIGHPITGDHDGDGDLEVALRTSLGTALFDVE
jgi:hypothetical protein